jgi:hypothetical protein
MEGICRCFLEYKNDTSDSNKTLRTFDAMNMSKHTFRSDSAL